MYDDLFQTRFISCANYILLNYDRHACTNSELPIRKQHWFPNWRQRNMRSEGPNKATARPRRTRQLSALYKLNLVDSRVPTFMPVFVVPPWCLDKAAQYQKMEYRPNSHLCSSGTYGQGRLHGWEIIIITLSVDVEDRSLLLVAGDSRVYTAFAGDSQVYTYS
jgi:hypothetical protein